jgi:peroxiredoxin
VVRGAVTLQLSIVFLDVPAGATSEIGLRAHVRAHYDPDAGTSDLPAPIHGEVRAVFDVRTVLSPSGRRLVVQPTAQDAKIEFVPAPGTGLGGADVSAIAAQVRRAIRENFTLLPVALPPDFPFTGFKGLATEFERVLALPLQLSGPPLPSSSLQSLTQPVVASSGFAFAVSQEHLRTLVDTEAIRQAIRERTASFLGATYRFRFSSGPTLTFVNGAIEVSGRVEVETSAVWAPNGFVSFRQAIILVLDAASQTVSLQTAGEPDVDESWFIPHGRAVNIVEAEMASALAASSAPVRRVFADGRQALDRGLATFDRSASARFTEVSISEHGVVVRGDIGSAARAAPVVEVGETDQRAAFTAWQSWIPGGRIERLVWSWVDYGVHPGIWNGVSKSFADEHRFIFPRPPGITELSHVCLRIEGTRTLPDGQVVSVAGGTTCLAPEPEVVLDVPSWWEAVTVPVWAPDLADDVVLRDAVLAHVDVQTPVPGRDQLTQNTLVCFPDWPSARLLDAAADAVARVRRQNAALQVIAVLPASAFDSRRREVDERLAAIRGRLATRLQVTEDAEGGWTRTFGVLTTPSIHLINARRQFVWKREGAPDAAALAAALDEHLLPAPAPRGRPLRLAVSPGDRAPDVSFHDGDHPAALHRLRGRPVLLNFWQSWSAPCLEELRRLQRVHALGADAPFVVAFHGAQDDRGLGAIRRSLGLGFPVVQDREQRIARRYGVRCWPTTIRIDAEGRVAGVQFGMAHGPEPAPDRRQEGPR